MVSPAPLRPLPGPGQAHALVQGAAASAVLLALGFFEQPPTPPQPAVVPPAAAARGRAPAEGSDTLAALCGPRTVPEGAACVPLPPPSEPDPHADYVPGGLYRGAGEHIPRLPDRPASASAYTYPLGAPGREPSFLAPPAAPAAPAPEPVSWEGGVALAAERGERVPVVQIEAQEGKAEVVLVGELRGITVGTAHAVKEGDRERRYLVLYGHLDRPGPGVVPGARLSPGDAIGFAGDSGSPGVVQLHLEARRVRDGASLDKLDPRRLADGAATVACDLRNVLPRR